VLSGGCLDLAEGSVPYLPLMDALHDLPIDTLPSLLMRWLSGVAEEPSPQHSEDAARGRSTRRTSKCFAPAAPIPHLRSLSKTCTGQIVVRAIYSATWYAHSQHPTPEPAC
jgi:hypothetical protein